MKMERTAVIIEREVFMIERMLEAPGVWCRY